MGETNLPRVPEGLRDILKSYTREVLREKPKNLYEFSLKYFEKIEGARKYEKVVKFEPQQSYEIVMKNRIRQQVPLSLAFHIVPESLTDVLKKFIKAVIKENPENLISFAIQYFKNLNFALGQIKYTKYAAYEKYIEENGKMGSHQTKVTCACGRVLSSKEMRAQVQETSSDTPQEVLKSSEQNKYNLYLKSVCIIQKNFRHYLKRKREKSAKVNSVNTSIYNSQEYLNAIYLIQRQFRRFLSKKRAKNATKSEIQSLQSYNSVKYMKAVLVIQRYTRQHLRKKRALNKARESRLDSNIALTRAAFIIQRAFRRMVKVRTAKKHTNAEIDQGDDMNDNASDAASYTSASTALLSTESAGDHTEFGNANYEEGVHQQTIKEDEEVENEYTNKQKEYITEAVKIREKSINNNGNDMNMDVGDENLSKIKGPDSSQNTKSSITDDKVLENIVTKKNYSLNSSEIGANNVTLIQPEEHKVLSRDEQNTQEDLKKNISYNEETSHSLSDSNKDSNSANSGENLTQKQSLLDENDTENDQNSTNSIADDKTSEKNVTKKDDSLNSNEISANNVILIQPEEHTNLPPDKGDTQKENITYKEETSHPFSDSNRESNSAKSAENFTQKGSSLEENDVNVLSPTSTQLSEPEPFISNQNVLPAKTTSSPAHTDSNIVDQVVDAKTEIIDGGEIPISSFETNPENQSSIRANSLQAVLKSDVSQDREISNNTSINMDDKLGKSHLEESGDENSGKINDPDKGQHPKKSIADPETSENILTNKDDSFISNENSANDTEDNKILPRDIENTKEDIKKTISHIDEPLDSLSESNKNSSSAEPGENLIQKKSSLEEKGIKVLSPTSTHLSEPEQHLEPIISNQNESSEATISSLANTNTNIVDQNLPKLTSTTSAECNKRLILSNETESPTLLTNAECTKSNNSPEKMLRNLSHSEDTVKLGNDIGTPIKTERDLSTDDRSSLLSQNNTGLQNKVDNSSKNSENDSEGFKDTVKINTNEPDLNIAETQKNVEMNKDEFKLETHSTVPSEENIESLSDSSTTHTENNSDRKNHKNNIPSQDEKTQSMKTQRNVEDTDAEIVNLGVSKELDIPSPEKSSAKLSLGTEKIDTETIEHCEDNKKLEIESNYQDAVIDTEHSHDEINNEISENDNIKRSLNLKSTNSSDDIKLKSNSTENSQTSEDESLKIDLPTLDKSKSVDANEPVGQDIDSTEKENINRSLNLKSADSSDDIILKSNSTKNNLTSEDESLKADLQQLSKSKSLNDSKVPENLEVENSHDEIRNDSTENEKINRSLNLTSAKSSDDIKLRNNSSKNNLTSEDEISKSVDESNDIIPDEEPISIVKEQYKSETIPSIGIEDNKNNNLTKISSNVKGDENILPKVTDEKRITTECTVNIPIISLDENNSNKEKHAESEESKQLKSSEASLSVEIEDSSENKQIPVNDPHEQPEAENKPKDINKDENQMKDNENQMKDESMANPIDKNDNQIEAVGELPLKKISEEEEMGPLNPENKSSLLLSNQLIGSQINECSTNKVKKLSTVKDKQSTSSTSNRLINVPIAELQLKSFKTSSQEGPWYEVYNEPPNELNTKENKAQLSYETPGTDKPGLEKMEISKELERAASYIYGEQLDENEPKKQKQSIAYYISFDRNDGKPSYKIPNKFLRKSDIEKGEPNTPEENNSEYQEVILTQGETHFNQSGTDLKLRELGAVKLQTIHELNENEINSELKNDVDSSLHTDNTEIKFEEEKRDLSEDAPIVPEFIPLKKTNESDELESENVAIDPDNLIRMKSVQIIERAYKTYKASQRQDDAKILNVNNNKNSTDNSKENSENVKMLIDQKIQLNKNHAANKIQKAFRKFMAKRAQNKTETVSLKNETAINVAALRIQNAFRRYIQRQKMAKPEWFVGSQRILLDPRESGVMESIEANTVEAPSGNADKTHIEFPNLDAQSNGSPDTKLATDIVNKLNSTEVFEKDNGSYNNLAGPANEIELELGKDLRALSYQESDAASKVDSMREIIKDFLIKEIEFSSKEEQDSKVHQHQDEVDEVPCVKRCVSLSNLDEEKLELGTEDKLDHHNVSDKDLDALESATLKLSRADEVIEKMSQRRSSELQEKPEKVGFHNTEAIFDEPTVRPMSSLQEQTSLDVEDSDIIVYNRLQREETRESSAQSDSVVFGNADEDKTLANDEEIRKAHLLRHYTIAGDDPHSMFSSISIADTVKYIDDANRDVNDKEPNSSSSFCLDDETSENIRKQILAYSLSEADSDYYDPNKIIKDDFHIDTAMTDAMDTSTETESTIVSAAAKIQAGARGFLTRRRLRRASAGTKSSTQDTKASFGNDAISESLERLIEEDAAKKIQVAYRLYAKKPKKIANNLKSASLESSLAAKRLTLQRGDALQNDSNSTPEDENSDTTNAGQPQANVETHLETKNEGRLKKKTNVRFNWPAVRQNSMPVQIDCEVLRVIPKHKRRRIKSAEEKHKNKLSLRFT